jgi:hypothetical protein
MKYLFVVAAAALVIGGQLSYAADSETALFNGRDLTGWTGDPKIWSVQDGAILGRTTPEVGLKANTFLIWTNGTVKDFELTCSYRLKPSEGNKFANSGIQYRSKVLDEKTWAVGGYQADMEAGPNYSGILYEEKMTRGIMAQRGEKVLWNSDCKKEVTGSVGDSAEIQKGIAQGGWNQYKIVAMGNHITHYINGKQTVDVTDECAKAATEGVIALQMHVGTPFTAEFKDIRLKKH